MLNQVVLIGRLTKDPELKKSKTGKSVSTVFVALNRNYTSADGIKADYPPVILWEKNAENTAKYCVKGSLVSIQGHLRTRKIEKENQSNVYVLEVVAEKIVFLDNRKKLDEDALIEETQEDIDELMNSLASQIPE